MEQSLADRIRMVRENQMVDGKKMSQEAFAKQLGVSRSVIKNLEYAKVEPQKPMLVSICSTFGINIDWLETGTGNMHPDFINPVADRINNLLEGENETAKAFFRMFSRFSDEDWELLQRFIDKLKAENI